MGVMFHAVMRAPGKASPNRTAKWSVPADHTAVSAGARKVPRMRLDDEDGATSARAIIVSSIFLILLAATLLFGGRAAIDPLLRSAMAAREANAVGDVVYSMPDGKFCRHMSFDNGTGDMAEGTVEQCPDDIARQEFRRTSSGFAWGEH
jgi:hypothetical protein